MAAPSAALDAVLLHHPVWRGGALAQAAPQAVPTGFAGLDRELPGGGWPAGALTEILCAERRHRRAAAGAARARRADARRQPRRLAGAAAPALCAGAGRRRRAPGVPHGGQGAGQARRAVGGGAGAARGHLPRAARVAAARQLRRTEAPGGGGGGGPGFHCAVPAAAGGARILSRAPAARRWSPMASGSPCASSSAAGPCSPPRCAFRSRGPSMLWVALCFPRLALEALLRGRAPPEGADDPWAVVENRSVLACNAAAAAAGVHPGSALAAAWALAPRLRTAAQCAAEAAALEAVAAWACQFTSRVSLEPPQAVLLEVEGSLRLFGGAGHLMARLRSGLAGIGFEALLAAGPDGARRALARARRRRDARGAAGLRHRPGPGGARAAAQDRHQDARRAAAPAARRRRAALRPGPARRARPGLRPDAGAARVLRAAGALRGPARAARAGGAGRERCCSPRGACSLQLEGFLAARQAGVRGFALSLAAARARRPPNRDRARRAAPRRGAFRAPAARAPRRARAARAGRGAAARGRGCWRRWPEQTPGLFDDARSERRTGSGWSSACRRGWASARCTGSPLHADHRPERAWRAVECRCGERQADSRRPAPAVAARAAAPARPKASSRCWRGPSASSRAGGTATRCGATTSSPARGDGSLAGSTASGGGRWFLHGLFA